jgi:hypothetical protein
MANSAQERINVKLEQIKSEYGAAIVDLLKEANRTRLKGKGRVTPAPAMDENSLRWSLSWQAGEISYGLAVVAHVADDGQQARVSKVWVHRHASTPLDFEGHTPTTRMRRLASLSLSELGEAINAECR